MGMGVGFCSRAVCVIDSKVRRTVKRMLREVQTEEDAIRFMKKVQFALRYNSTPSLPLASMYAAAGDKRTAIELTNLLLARDEVVETNVIANRLVLAHRAIVPALYKLRCALRPLQLSEYATKAFALIADDGSASAGDVRRFLGVDGMRRPDPADLALAELQRDMLVDRGPVRVPEKGIPYLSREGYPYRVFEKAHPDLVRAAKKLRVDQAMEDVRRAAGSMSAKKFESMFKLLLGRS
jgi:hypothetical protein